MKKLACVVTVVLCGCGPKHVTPKTIKLGAIISQTGSLAFPENLNAIQLAVTEINQKLATVKTGYLAGATFTVTNVDDKSDPDGGVAAANQLISQGVSAIIGAESSDLALAIASVAIPAKTIFVTGDSTSPAITALQNPGDTRYVYRTCPSDALQGKLLAEQTAQLTPAVTRAATLFQPNAYGQGLSGAFKAAFTGTLTGEVQLPSGQPSYRTQLAQIFAANPAPQAILMVTDVTIDGAQVITDYKTNYPGQNTFWFFTDALDNSNFTGGVTGSFPTQNEGTVPSSSSGATYDAFKASFQSTYSTAPQAGVFDEHFYDAVYLIALAIDAAKATDGPAIAAQMQKVSAGPGSKYGPPQFAQALADIDSGKGCNYEGASGSVDFDQNGDVVGPYDIWQVGANKAISVIKSAVSP